MVASEKWFLAQKTTESGFPFRPPRPAMANEVWRLFGCECYHSFFGTFTHLSADDICEQHDGKETPFPSA